MRAQKILISEDVTESAKSDSNQETEEDIPQRIPKSLEEELIVHYDKFTFRYSSTIFGLKDLFLIFSGPRQPLHGVDPHFDDHGIFTLCYGRTASLSRGCVYWQKKTTPALVYARKRHRYSY